MIHIPTIVTTYSSSESSTSQPDHSGLWIALTVIGVLFFLVGTAAAVFIFKGRQSKQKDKDERITLPRKFMFSELSGIQILEKIGEGNSLFLYCCLVLMNVVLLQAISEKCGLGTVINFFLPPYS
jgi:hypothetical protein